MRVLLVEDNEGDADLVRDALRLPHADDVELIHVERLSTAAERLSRERFDVILLDLSLPDAIGLEGLERLRQAAPSAPIVVLSGLVDEVANRRALQSGAQDFLQKGHVAGDALLRAIRYAQERQHHLERARLLADVGAALGRSLDPSVMAEGLVEVVNKDYASWCGLQGAAELAGSFDEARPAQAGGGRAVLYGALAGTDDGGQDGACTRDLRARGMESAIVVRFTANGRTDGILLFGRDANRVAFGPADQDVAVEITARLTAALEHAGVLAIARHERERAQAAGQLRDDFLATLSHELRTPLGAILGWTQLLRSGALPPEKQAKALETIERNTLSQAALIDDILDISRIITGKMRLDIQSVNLAVVVAGAAETVRPAADARGVHLSLEIAEVLEPMPGDPDRLQQVLWNLLTNAVKFTPRGGHVRVTVRRMDGSIEIAVADTGQGIPAEFLPHVFERFRQADSSKKRRHSGLGLGLGIAQQLVEMHGGAIRAESDGAGHGTTFTIRLPGAVLASAPRSPARHRANGGPAGADYVVDLSGLVVMIVDDDPDTLELLRSLFEIAGGDIATATSVEEAFAALAARPADLLVSDIGMPGATGYDLIRKIRALPSERGGGIKAIALTAYARAEDRAEALGAGFDRHVAKPVQPRELLAIADTLTRPAA